MKILLQPLAEQLGHALKKRHWKLVTAESCTGGGMAYWLTAIPGSSEWFDRGFVTYSNAAKIEQLSVSAETIDQFGAVSEATVRAMAEGALKHSQAQLSVAITGMAGPDGGTTQKPVGTVWFAWASAAFATQSQLVTFSGDRETIRQRAIAFALEQCKQLVEQLTA